MQNVRQLLKSIEPWIRLEELAELQVLYVNLVGSVILRSKENEQVLETGGLFLCVRVKTSKKECIFTLQRLNLIHVQSAQFD